MTNRNCTRTIHVDQDTLDDIIDHPEIASAIIGQMSSHQPANIRRAVFHVQILICLGAVLVILGVLLSLLGV